MLEKFQALDYAGMMLITGAGIQGKFAWMSNGANLAYPRELFYELNGFEGIDQVASGVDMLFMQKVAEHFPNKIGFLKSKKAVVFVYCTFIFISFLWTFLFGWFALLLFFLLILVKYVNDFFLLRTASRFFGISKLMTIFPFAEWLHTGYIFWVGMLSLFVKQHEWKGRKVK